MNAGGPVVTYVSPKGARAASAGAFMVYASHLAAMAPGTNIGAATPVNVAGQNASEHSAMDKKIVNDAVAYLRSLAEFRDRNVVWAEQAVREGSSISAEQALDKKVIEYLAEDLPSLLEQLDGVSVPVADKTGIKYQPREY